MPASKRVQLALTAALVLLFPAAPARAETAVSGDSSIGPGSRSWSLDANFEPSEGWETYAAGEASEGDLGRSSSFSAGARRALWKDAKVSLGAARWEDPDAKMTSLGPEFGLDTPLGPFEASFGCELAFYRSDVFQPPRAERRRRRTVVHPAQTERVHMSQWHPSATLSLPLWGGALTPSVYAGRAFYSRDPAEVVEKVGELEFARNAELVADHVGGFLSHDAEAALDAELPGGVSARMGLGAERSATDAAWTMSQSASLSATVAEVVDLSLEWNRSRSYGERQDTWSLGAGVRFGGSAKDDDEDDGDDEEEES